MVALLNIAFLYQYKNIIDAIVSGQRSLFLIHIAVIFLIVAVMLVFEYIRQILNVSFLNHTSFQLQSTIVGHIFKKPFDKFSRHSTGYYLSQVNNDLEQVADSYYDSLFTIFQGCCSFLFASLALLSLDALPALFVIVISFLPVIIPYLFKNKMRRNRNHVSQAQQAYNVKLSDTLDDFLSVKNTLETEKIVSELGDRYQFINTQRRKANQTTVAMRILVGVAFYATTLLIIGVGGYQVFEQKLTIGGLTAILTISEQLVDSINSIAAAFLERHGVKDLVELFHPKNDAPISKGTICEPIKTITLRDIEYPLDDGRTLFHRANYTFEAGKKYLLIGPSGCGKSTLGLIITKNIALESGAVFFNDQSIDNLSYQSIQSKIAYVPQQGHLYQDSVLYNLTLGVNISETDIFDFITLVGLEKRFPDINSLSEVLTDDSGLSGG